MTRDVEARWMGWMNAERRLREGVDSIVLRMYSRRKDVGKGIPVLT